MVFHQPSLSVIVPVLNGGEDFRRCLQSIRQGETQPNELIVVNDGSRDDSGNIARQFGAKVIDLPRAHGPAFARNRGASLAEGEILFFVDADVTVQPDTVRKVVQAFRDQPQMDALIGSYDDQPGAENFTSQYRNLLHHYTHQVSSTEASTFWGACGAVRRSVFLSVGGFDEGYRVPCVEDIELGYRFKREGYSIRLCKGIQVKHLKRWEPVKMIKTDIFCRALPWTNLLLRDRQPMNDLNLKRGNQLSVVCSFISLLGFLAPLSPTMFSTTALFGLAGIVILNQDIYRFFLARRGLSFALKSMAYHWLFYVYSGVAYAMGLANYHLRLQGDRQASKPLTTIPAELRQSAQVQTRRQTAAYRSSRQAVPELTSVS